MLLVAGSVLPEINQHKVKGGSTRPTRASRSTRSLTFRRRCQNPADVARGGTNSSVDYDIQNARVLASQVTLDSALVESFNRVLLSGRSLVFSYPAVHTQLTSIPAGSTEFNVTVSRAFTKLLGAFVTFRTLTDQPNVAALNHPGTQADGTSFLESQMALGSMQVPHYPAKDFAEHHHFLQILANTYDSSIRNMRLTKNMYEGSSFIAAYPVQRVPGMPLSGISTRSGDLARFSFKGLQADKVQQCYVHLVSYGNNLKRLRSVGARLVLARPTPRTLA